MLSWRKCWNIYVDHLYSCLESGRQTIHHDDARTFRVFFFFFNNSQWFDDWYSVVFLIIVSGLMPNHIRKEGGKMGLRCSHWRVPLQSYLMSQCYKAIKKNFKGISEFLYIVRRTMAHSHIAFFFVLVI